MIQSNANATSMARNLMMTPTGFDCDPSTQRGGLMANILNSQSQMMNNSEDLLTTIDGDKNSFFTNRFHTMQLEQKDDTIE